MNFKKYLKNIEKKFVEQKTTRKIKPDTKITEEKINHEEKKILGFVDSDYLKKRRKYVVIIIFAVAAILTPPDPITQIGLGIPLLILYELSILSVKIIEKKKKDA